MRVAAIQTVSGGDVAANLAQAEPLVAEAAARGAQLAVLPEYFGILGAPPVANPDAATTPNNTPATLTVLANDTQGPGGTSFDPATVDALADYETPNRYSRGSPYVAVNGVLVVDGGKPTGATPGKALRGPGYKP